MKLSNGFWQTYKEIPSEAEIPSHQLMLRAGLIHKSGAGLYNYLPIGLRSIQKVERIIREELNKIGCYELAMTVVTPGELWKESKRWDQMGDLMLKAKDRAGRDICLSPTNEEAIVDIFKKTIKSYKQLPLTLYQINTKFRDEIRPRFGIMRGREFTMKDAYSFHDTWESLDLVYEDLYKAYQNIFRRMGLDFMAVEADGGAMADGKAKTHEFQVLADSGEDKIIRCIETNYAANIERAETFRKIDVRKASENKLTEVETPNKQTLEEVSAFLKKPASEGLKCLLYAGIKGEKEEKVMVVLLGDDELNEIKLKGILKADHVRPLVENELKELNLIKGYIGPHGAGKELKIIVDSCVDETLDYFTGANKENYHVMNFILNRDISKDNYEKCDLRLSKSGDIHRQEINGKIIEGMVQEMKGIEVGHIFQLGDKYTKSMNATVLDKNGKAVHPFMGCYGIGTTRTVAAAIEQNHDENGIIWPLAMAPYHIHFSSIVKSDEMIQLAEEIYKNFLEAGFEVLFDDRDKVGAGFKMKDADLLGLPLRIVFGERDYLVDKMLEIKVRKTGEVIKVEKENLISKVTELLGVLSC